MIPYQKPFMVPSLPGKLSAVLFFVFWVLFFCFLGFFFFFFFARVGEVWVTGLMVTVPGTCAGRPQKVDPLLPLCTHQPFQVTLDHRELTEHLHWVMHLNSITLFPLPDYHSLPHPTQAHSSPILTNSLSSFKTQCKGYILCKVFFHLPWQP